MSRSPTPLALFAYNRPDHVARALESLAACRRIDACRVCVFCDGPRAAEDAGAVAATRAVVESWIGRLGGEIRAQETNLGLARSIVSGVTDLCQQYGRVIVVEDDLEVSPDFVDFLLIALDRYADARDVCQVSGYMFPVDHPERPDGFFLPLTTTWGWATWARAWQAFDWSASAALSRLADPGVRHRFDLHGSYPYSKMLEDRLAGRNDSWGILWAWSVFQVNGLVLHPRRSLVFNGGWDGSGTHCGRRREEADEQRLNVLTSRIDRPFVLPETVNTDEAAFERVIGLLRQRGGSPRPAAASAGAQLVQEGAGRG